jgi:hypothetical protein
MKTVTALLEAMPAAVVIAALCLVTNASLADQPKPRNLKQLNEKVNELEERVQALERLIAPQLRQAALREQFEKRQAVDLTRYTPAQLREAEQLYQAMNKDWNSPPGKAALEALVEQFPDINRTGCAFLYLGQVTDGQQKEMNLQTAIDKHSDCMYGDGVQVGAYARYLLAQYYKQKGNNERAEALLDEMKKEYPLAIDHRGRALIEPEQKN